MHNKYFFSQPPAPLSEETVRVVKATAPAVAVHAETITRTFYQRMFAGNPEVKQYFNQAHQREGGQQRALAGAICAYAANIEQLEALAPALELIAQKHCSLGIQPEHYPIVGKHLLAAVKEVLGDPVTEEVVSAWGEAYGLLADLLIEREAEIYAEQARAEGGWNGYRPLVVACRERESDVITSFYLRPADQNPLPPFLPGQYITVNISHPATPTSPRNYSLSDRPGLGHYRISVKRESAPAPSAPGGLISNYLHDRVREGDSLQIGPPCGEFTLSPEDAGSSSSTPIVLISGGVGLTPMMSMLKTLAHCGTGAPVYFIHGALNSSTHAFAGEVRQACGERPNIVSHFRYSEPLPDDLREGRCDSTGMIGLELLRELLPTNRCNFYFCGPKPFMNRVYGSLKRWNVPEEMIRYEFFGPKQDLRSAA